MIDKANRVVKYADGWNDARIAKFVVPDGSLSVNSVATYRQDVYGNLFVRGLGGGDSQSEKLAELETRINDVNHQMVFNAFCLGELIDRFDKLCDTVAMKQLADVRYLKLDMAKMHTAFDARIAERVAQGAPPPWYKPNGSGAADTDKR